MNIKKDKDLYNSFKEGVYRLSKISIRMRTIGILLIIFTMFNIALMALFGTKIMTVDRYDLFLFIPVAIIILVFSLGLPLYFDILRRDGDAFFEEISDQMHGEKFNSNEQGNEDSILFNAKIELKRFAKSAELPILPGKFGPAIAFMINLTVLVLFLFFVNTYAK